MTRAEKIENYISELCLDLDVLSYIVDIEEIYSFNDIMRELERAGAFDAEGTVIYYSEAMKYLMEHDMSLRESLEIAEELGYTPSGLSSETLATLHKIHSIKEEILSYEDDINEFLEQIKYEEEEVENE